MTQKRQITPWFSKSVIYQINLRTFTKEGTIAAAERLLPHVKSLGIDLVYLCPFVMSDDDMNEDGWSNRQKKSETGNPKNSYRISDYFTIDPEYGTDSDMESFVKKAHSLGLRVMFDLVYMHCGPNAVFIEEHPDFVQRNEDGSIRLTEYHFPYVNFESEGLREYLYENMLHFVRKFDIDGYRCDVGDACPVDFWQEGCRRVRELKPDFAMLNEGRSKEFLGTCFDANYGFEFCYRLVDILRDAKFNAKILKEKWQFEVDNQMASGKKMIRWYENHDIANDSYGNRIDILDGGIKGEMALATVFMIDGIPMLFNGNEIADCCVSSFFANRFCKNFTGGIDWSNLVTERGTRRLEFVKKLIRMRHSSALLEKGKTIWLDNDRDEKILSFAREYRGKRMALVANTANEAVTCHCETGLSVDFMSRGVKQDGDSFVLEPYGYIILK